MVNDLERESRMMLANGWGRLEKEANEHMERMRKQDERENVQEQRAARRNRLKELKFELPTLTSQVAEDERLQAIEDSQKPSAAELMQRQINVEKEQNEELTKEKESRRKTNAEYFERMRKMRAMNKEEINEYDPVLQVEFLEKLKNAEPQRK